LSEVFKSFARIDFRAVELVESLCLACY